MGINKKTVFRFWLAFLIVPAFFISPLIRVQDASAAAGINSQLSFEGKIVKSDGTNISDGTYNMEFKIYQDGNNQGVGSTLKWTEDWLVGGNGGVALTSGTFQANLGAHNPFASQVDWNQDTLWLSMQIGNSSSCTISTTFQSNCSGDGEMKPYIRLTAVPYAQNSASLGGLVAGNFVQLAQGLQTDTSSTNASIAVNKTGSTANILQFQKSSADVFVISNTGTVLSKSNSTTGFQVQDSSNNKPLFTVDTSGDQVLLGMANTGGVTGKLTFNNSSNTSTVSIVSGATSGTYSITLPTAVAGGSNYCLVSTTGGVTSWTACGASSSTRTVTLTPEYPGAALTPANTANGHTGTMTSDFCGNDGAGSFPDVNTSICASGQYHNYYSWTANATNDYDVWTQWQVPGDYASISSITFYGWTTSTSDAVKLTVYKSGTACGNSSVNPTASWSSTTVSTSGCTIAAGDNLFFDMDMKIAVNSEFARAGEIIIVYNRS